MFNGNSRIEFCFIISIQCCWVTILVMFSSRLFYRYYSKAVLLTKDTYKVKRGNYCNISDRHLQLFERILGTNGVITDKEDVESYNVDWLKTLRGCSEVVLRPKSTTEVSEILRLCNQENLAVCPQGGNTGLVGGSVPVFDEIVISMNLMNNTLCIDDIGGSITCEAGCILEKLDSELADYNLMMPLDLGAKGSCQIGGNISTSAGGLRLLRYGSMQANTLGLQVVLADGSILDLMNALKKDNTGYHLKQLFIGAEGTLGIITKAIISCPVRPKSVCLAFLAVNDFNKVIEVYSMARSELAETLSSCEMMDAGCMDSVKKELGLNSPLSENSDFYMLIEMHGSRDDHDMDKMERFLEKTINHGIVINGTFTNDAGKMNYLWQLRERISESMSVSNCVYKYDLTLPLNKYYDVVHVVKNKLEGTTAENVVGFGHVGDGNIHVNIQSKEFDLEIEHSIEPYIFEWTYSQGGSMSAEHGIGFKKAAYLGKFGKSNEAVDIMSKIKLALDPKCIMNPYKIFENCKI